MSLSRARHPRRYMRTDASKPPTSRKNWPSTRRHAPLRQRPCCRSRTAVFQGRPYVRESAETAVRSSQPSEWNGRSRPPGWSPAASSSDPQALSSNYRTLRASPDERRGGVFGVGLRKRMSRDSKSRVAPSFAAGEKPTLSPNRRTSVLPWRSPSMTTGTAEALSTTTEA